MSVLVSSTAHLTQPSGSSTDIFLSLCSKQRSCYSCPACLSPVSWFWLNGSLITVLLKWKAKCLTWTPPFPLSPPSYLPVCFRTGPPKRTLPFCSAHFSCSAALHGCSTLLPSRNPPRSSSFHHATCLAKHVHRHSQEIWIRTTGRGYNVQWFLPSSLCSLSLKTSLFFIWLIRESTSTRPKFHSPASVTFIITYLRGGSLFQNRQTFGMCPRKVTHGIRVSDSSRPLGYS